jgi:hypothetical protein
MAPCFYRAPTDNDRGGFSGTSHAARWACQQRSRPIRSLLNEGGGTNVAPKVAPTAKFSEQPCSKTGFESGSGLVQLYRRELRFHLQYRYVCY